MRLHRLLPVLVVILCWSVLAPPSVAQPRHRAGGSVRGYELNPYLTHVEFDPDVELDDEFGVGFRFGYLFNPHHEIEFMLNDVTTNDTVVPGINVDVTNFQVAYVFNFTRRDVIPYFTAGVGFLHTDDESLGDESDQVLGLGGGVRFFLGRSFYVRFEYRQNFFTGDGR